tara:strand:+ start:1619 stop:2185 length:567 start_codon:yes stop_codon:yes gene_type:complete
MSDRELIHLWHKETLKSLATGTDEIHKAEEESKYWSSKTAYSSEKDDWETPQSLFEVLDDEHHFTLDPCATHQNAKCEKYYTVEDNGLLQDWSNDIVFMNPPYGKNIKYWVEKAHIESLRGAEVVCLLPARTDTIYWHKYIFSWKYEVKFIKGRLKFEVEGKPGNPAPFPSAIVFMNGSCDYDLRFNQ